MKKKEFKKLVKESIDEVENEEFSKFTRETVKKLKEELDKIKQMMREDGYDIK
jgi:hypothetical protein